MSVAVTDVSAANQSPVGSAVVQALMGGLWTGGSPKFYSGWTSAWYKAYNTAGIVMRDPNFVNAVKVGKGLNTDQKVWSDIYNALYESPSNATQVQQWNDYKSSIQQLYSDATGRLQSFKEQSRVAAGRRPTILTSGRGASGTPSLALKRLKSQLGA